MTTLGTVAEFDKECVAHALAGELYAGEDGHGYVFEWASKDECDRFVLDTFDKWYYQAKQLADSARAIERVLAAHGWHIDFHEFAKAKAVAEQEFNDFLFERDKRDLEDELARIERQCNMVEAGKTSIGKDSESCSGAGMKAKCGEPLTTITLQELLDEKPDALDVLKSEYEYIDEITDEILAHSRSSRIDHLVDMLWDSVLMFYHTSVEEITHMRAGGDSSA